MEEMIRIHKLWQGTKSLCAELICCRDMRFDLSYHNDLYVCMYADTKDELRAAVRARDALVREWEEDRLRLEHEHKQHMHQTIQQNELLKAETRARADQLTSARKENDCM
jgi:hypothetical protein